MTQQGSPPFQSQIESVALALPAGPQEDFRTLMQAVWKNIVTLSPGGQLLRPGGAQAGSGTPPAGIQFSVAGANGAFTISIQNPKGSTGNNIWHEVSYSTVKSFAQSTKGSPTVMPPTTGTSIQIPSPGTTYFFRLRSSFDLVTWSNYQYASTASVSSGLVSSAATSEAGAFNQTNYGIVTSTAVGSTAEVSIQGASGPLTSLVAQKGPQQRILPGATVLGVTPGSDQFVGFDGRHYILRPTLAGVLSDDGMTPIGKVSVVNTATPTPPVITPILSGGQILGYNVISGGAGASQPYNLSLGSTGGGSGATFGAQTIVAGVLISVGSGNPGTGYSGGTTVIVAGGSGGGTPGGGTAVGGNGGRMTAV